MLTRLNQLMKLKATSSATRPHAPEAGGSRRSVEFVVPMRLPGPTRSGLSIMREGGRARQEKSRLHRRSVEVDVPPAPALELPDARLGAGDGDRAALRPDLLDQPRAAHHRH